MIYHVPMPSLGADMDHGKLMDWKIKPGDDVKKGQMIAVVETTKSTVEIESFKDGKVLDLKGHVGDEIPVGQEIATFDVVGSDLAPAIPLKEPEGRIKISPAARKLALEKNIDLTKIKGSGSEGQIELKDLQVTPLQPHTGSNLREAIAKAMSHSKKEIPHYYLKSQVSLDSLMSWIDEKNKILPSEQRLLVPVVLFKAILESLKEYPVMNGYYKNGVFEVSEMINLGIAIALKSGGVLVPAILDAQKMNLAELNAAFQELAQRTVKGELKNRELTEGTVTITNMGDLGAEEVLGIIFPPQVALIGLGRIHKAPVVDKEIIRAGFVMDLTLSADHRVTDGLTGARFMALIEKKIKNPIQLEG
jgi:pyruvate dehydrogenase E2 component (dihydrolipoamide acetyltransferase)